MKLLAIAFVCGTAFLIAAALVVVAVTSNRQQPLPQPEVQTMPMPSEVHVNAIEHKSVTIAGSSGASASPTVSIVCGNGATADRYEARNDALRSIARRRDLPENAETARLYLEAVGKKLDRAEMNRDGD